MVEIIMMIAIMFFFIGFFFEKVMKIAASEWKQEIECIKKASRAATLKGDKG